MSKKQKRINKPTVPHTPSKRLLPKLIGQVPNQTASVKWLDGTPGVGKTEKAVNDYIINGLAIYKPIVYLAETHRLVEEVKERYFDGTSVKFFHKQGFSKRCPAHQIIKVHNSRSTLLKTFGADLTFIFLGFAKMVRDGYPPKRLCKICRDYKFKQNLVFPVCTSRSDSIMQRKAGIIGTVRHYLGTQELKNYERIIADDLSWLSYSFRSYRKKIILDWFTLKMLSNRENPEPDKSVDDTLFQETDESFEEWCKAIHKHATKVFKFKISDNSLFEDIFEDPTNWKLLWCFDKSKFQYWRRFDQIYSGSKQYLDYPMIFSLFDLAREVKEVILIGSIDNLLDLQLKELVHRYELEYGCQIYLDKKRVKRPKGTKKPLPDHIRFFRALSNGRPYMYWKSTIIEPTNTKSLSYKERVKNVQRTRRRMRKTITLFLEYLAGVMNLPIHKIRIGLIIYQKLHFRGNQWLIEEFFPKNYPIDNLRVLHYNNLRGSNRFMEDPRVHAMVQIGSYVKNPKAALRDFKGLYPHYTLSSNLKAVKNRGSDEYTYGILQVDAYIRYINLYERKQAIMRSRGEMPVLVFGDIPLSLQAILPIRTIEIKKLSGNSTYTFMGYNEWEELLIKEMTKIQLDSIRIYSSNSSILTAYSLLKSIKPDLVPSPRSFYTWTKHSTLFTIKEVITKQSKQAVRVLVPK